MGLLDDAIREHLELKRRRGADPGEVARAEREALEPGFPDEPPSREADLAPPGGTSDTFDEVAAVSLPAADAGQPERGGGLASLGQDTAELDMLTVLEGQHEGSTAPAPARPVPAAEVREPLSAGPTDEESLESEMLPSRAGSESEAEGAHAEGIEDPHGTAREGADSEASRPAPGGSDFPADVPGQERLTFE